MNVNNSNVSINHDSNDTVLIDTITKFYDNDDDADELFE